jgi:hypothetical protein
MSQGIAHFSKCDAAQRAVFAGIPSLGRVVVPLALVLFFDRGGLFFSKKMRLARFPVPGLDQAGQERKPAQTDFKRHPGIRIRLFGSKYKQDMSQK